MFQILRGGCNTRHPSSFFRSRPEGTNNWLVLIIKTPAQFSLNGRLTKVAPNTAIIISPQSPYEYHNPDGEYMDDWLHFSFPDDEFSIENLLSPNTFFPVKDMDSLSLYIRQMLWENTYNKSRFRSDNIDHLMHIFLNHLSTAFAQKESSNSYNSYNTKLQEIRLVMQSSLYDSKNANFFAKSLGISKSHFQHLYTMLFGISFQQDYIQMRIDYAKDLLETTDMPMEQIAEMCGYANEVHFYRQFKTYIEMTPAKYRRRFRNKM